MKNIFVAIIFLLVSQSAANAHTTTFTYQGNLSISGSPANGTFPMQFSLRDAPAGGNQIGPASSQNVDVTNGVFSVRLDFGAAAFPGTDRFLQVTANLNTFPRIPLLSSPYAIRARTVTGPISDTSSGSVLSTTNTGPGITNPSPSNLPPAGLTEGPLRHQVRPRA
jgi:hypothetical protein